MDDFHFIGGDLAVDFVNTVGDRWSRPSERLVTGADVDRWARQAGLLAPKASLRLDAGQVARIRSVRETVHRVLYSLATGQAPSAAALSRFDAARARVARKRHLVWSHRRVTWQWITGKHDPDRVLGPILEHAADLLVSAPPGQLRQCGDAGCGWLFLDRSRAGRRRWCRMADCGNRAKARRHYQRGRRA